MIFLFSEAGTIVTGWKGTIFFRHDTLLDNYTGYDFRNCKFRRWKFDIAAWDIGTTYGQGDFAIDSGFLYRSIFAANIGNAPSDSSDFWVQLVNLSFTEYWNTKPTATNNILSDAASFADFKTFAEGTGNATYEFCCRANHIESFKDNDTIFTISGTILSNWVFHLQDDGIFTVYNNQIAAQSYANTIGDTFYENIIGTYFTSNLISAEFNNNEIGLSFSNNTIGNNFGTNVVASNFNSCFLGVDFAGNIIGGSFAANSIGSQCQVNYIGNHFAFNFAGKNFISNVIGSNFTQSKMISGFRNNVVTCDVTNIDFTSSTKVYGFYSKTIFTNENIELKLSYFDTSNVLTVVNANA